MKSKCNCLDKAVTASKAAKMWGLEMSTVRRACNDGRFGGDEARKSAGTWLVTVEAMERLYGKRPAE